MSFWEITNINMWTLVGVLFCIFWILFKALIHDAEKHEERIRDLERGESDIWEEINKLKKKVRNPDVSSKDNGGKVK